MTAEEIFDDEVKAIKKDRRAVVLTIYDITDDKRRLRMVKCLERFGVRVQRSAFEAFLDKERYERMKDEASRLIDENEDSLRIYVLRDPLAVRTWGRGDTHTEDVIII